MAKLTHDELEQALLKMLEKMIERKQMPAMNLEEMKKIIQPVVNALEKTFPQGIEKEQLLDNKFQKSLICALSISYLNVNNPDPKNKLEFDLTVLFKKDNELNDKEFKSELKKLFNHLYKLEPSNKKKNENEKQEDEKLIDELVEKISELMKLKMSSSFDIKKESELTTTLRSQFAGINIAVPGSIPSVVYIAEKNPTFTNFTVGFLYSAIGQDKDISRNDEKGAIRQTEINMLSLDSLVDDLAQTFKNEGLLTDDIAPEKPVSHSPFKTRPDPLNH